MSKSPPTDALKTILKTSSELDIRVVVADHANCDSLPLRFGLHFKTDVVLKLRRARFDRDDSQYPNRCHVEAEFEGRNGMTSGHFVLAARHGGCEPVVVTVWRHDGSTEFSLSEVMTSLRKNGFLTPDDLLALHPLYASGKLRTHADRVQQLSLKMSAARVTAMEKAAAEANRKADEAHAAREEAQRNAEHNREVALEATYALDRSESRFRDLTAVNERLAAENESYKAEQTAARQARQNATLSSPDTLIEVRERQPHRGSLCTILIMADATRRHIKVATFDVGGKVTDKAKSLVGRRVKVSSWDPINEPGKWSQQGYFRNIYATDD